MLLQIGFEEYDLGSSPSYLVLASCSSVSDSWLILPGRERAELPAAAIWAARPGKPSACDWCETGRGAGACLGRGEAGVAR